MVNSFWYRSSKGGWDRIAPLLLWVLTISRFECKILVEESRGDCCPPGEVGKWHFSTIMEAGAFRTSIVTESPTHQTLELAFCHNSSIQSHYILQHFRKTYLALKNEYLITRFIISNYHWNSKCDKKNREESHSYHLNNFILTHRSVTFLKRKE